MTALRKTAVSMLRACEDGGYGFDPDRFGCIQEMMESSPQVFGRSLEHGQKKQALVTAVIAERMGVDPMVDLRPHVAAGLSTARSAARSRSWATAWPRPSGFPRHSTRSSA